MLTRKNTKLYKYCKITIGHNSGFLMDQMINDTQYEIYIGCNDQQTKNELVNGDDLLILVNEFFAKKKVNYSATQVEGGYFHEDGFFVFEKTLCITIIGNQNFDIVKYAKALSMYMNQECFMITKKKLKYEYR